MLVILDDRFFNTVFPVGLAAPVFSRNISLASSFLLLSTQDSIADSILHILQGVQLANVVFELYELILAMPELPSLRQSSYSALHVEHHFGSDFRLLPLGLLIRGHGIGQYSAWAG